MRIWTFDSKADDLENCAQLGGSKRNLPQDWLSAQILKPLQSFDAPNNFLDEVHSNSISAMVATNGVLFTASVDFSVCCWAKNKIKQKQNRLCSSVEIYNDCAYRYASSEGAVTALCSSKNELIIFDRSGKIVILGPRKIREIPKFPGKRSYRGHSPQLHDILQDRTSFFKRIRFVYGKRDKSPDTDFITLGTLFYGRKIRWEARSNKNTVLEILELEKGTSPPPASRGVRWIKTEKTLENTPEDIPDSLDIHKAAVPLVWMWQILSQVMTKSTVFDPACGLQSRTFEELKRFATEPLLSNSLVKGQNLEKHGNDHIGILTTYCTTNSPPRISTDVFLNVMKNAITYLEYYESIISKHGFVRRNCAAGKETPTGSKMNVEIFIDILLWVEWLRRHGPNLQTPQFIEKVMNTPRVLRNMNNNEFTANLIKHHHIDRSPHAGLITKDIEKVVKPMQPPIPSTNERYVGPLKAVGTWDADGHGLRLFSSSNQAVSSVLDANTLKWSDCVDRNNKKSSNFTLSIFQIEESSFQDNVSERRRIRSQTLKGIPVSNLLEAHVQLDYESRFYSDTSADNGRFDPLLEDSRIYDEASSNSEGIRSEYSQAESSLTSETQIDVNSAVEMVDLRSYGFVQWGNNFKKNAKTSENDLLASPIDTATLPKQRQDEAMAFVHEDFIIARDVGKLEVDAKLAHENVSITYNFVWYFLFYVF